VGFALIATGSLLCWIKLPKGEDIIVAGFTLIGRAMVTGSQTKP
jgi:hypothetical protein